MAIVDTDLLAIQDARVALEGALRAQSELEAISKDEQIAALIAIQTGIKDKLAAHISHFVEETDFGSAQDELELALWVIDDLYSELMSEEPAGALQKDAADGSYTMRFSRGVAFGLLADWLFIPSFLCELAFAIWSKSALIVSVRPRIQPLAMAFVREISALLDTAGYPKDALYLLEYGSLEADSYLLQSPHVQTLIYSRDVLPHALSEAYAKRAADGSSFYSCDFTNNPVFIEKSADLTLAADELISAKAFCNGLLPGAEESVVVESCVAPAFREILTSKGAQFLSQEEAERLGSLLFSPTGEVLQELMGKSVEDLARRANIELQPNTKIFIIEQPYVSTKDCFATAKRGPILSFYVEDDWQNACEKCIELILGEKAGNVLSIFSNDAAVISAFSLKKPVGRLVVNCSAALGAIGAHTKLPKTLLLSGWNLAQDAGPGVDAHSFTKTKRIAFGLAH